MTRTTIADEYTRDMLTGYVDAAMWSESLGDEVAAYIGGNAMPDTSLSAVFDLGDIAEETLAKMRADVEDFFRANRAALLKWYADPSYAGHDFWLTRNGHGTGFWSRGHVGAVMGAEYRKAQNIDVAEQRRRVARNAALTRLSEASKSYGETSLYVGDDDRIHLI